MDCDNGKMVMVKLIVVVVVVMSGDTFNSSREVYNILWQFSNINYLKKQNVELYPHPSETYFYFIICL
jgi:hypothetical protein